MIKDKKNIDLYKSIFRGRNDVYAVRWVKDGRSGYMPAYKVDWTDYNKHKAQGGTFKDYKNKEYLPFDNSAIEGHLSEKETILKLFDTCCKYNIPSYIERSRSGNGGHLWVFFEDAFPAEQSRKIMFELLHHSNIISHFEKEPSFDRMFPNQDYHSGKGLGNLIALPLQGKSVTNGNSCFISPDTFDPIENQWEYLGKMKRVSLQVLKLLYEEFFNIIPNNLFISNTIADKTFELEIVISNQIYLKRAELSQKLIFLYIGNILYQVNQQEYLAARNIRTEVNIKETDLFAPFDYKIDKYETILRIVISTGQFFGEGIDISNLECLFIVYPFAFEGMLIQYMGRIQRSEKRPVIFDYRDSKIEYFEKMFKQRKRYYNKLFK